MYGLHIFFKKQDQLEEKAKNEYEKLTERKGKPLLF